MYLLNADQVNSVLSNQSVLSASAVATGVRDVSRYSSPLALIKTRCEELMEIDTLDRASYTDTFQVTGKTTREHVLRLTNGFLTSTPAVAVTFLDDFDTPVGGNYDIDVEKGTVSVRLAPGRYRVTYTSGFEADADGVFIDVPDWLQSIAKMAMAIHYRLTTNADKTPANVSYADIIEAMRRDLYVRVTKRYNRPRVDATFPIRSLRNG